MINLEGTMWQFTPVYHGTPPKYTEYQPLGIDQAKPYTMKNFFCVYTKPILLFIFRKSSVAPKHQTLLNSSCPEVQNLNVSAIPRAK